MDVDIGQSSASADSAQIGSGCALPAEEKRTKRIRLLINRNFALLWFGQAISLLGDYVFDTTLVLWIATQIGWQRSWTPLAVSALFFINSLPILVIGPLAGVFVDRWDKRMTMAWMDLLRAVLIGGLLCVAGAYSSSVGAGSAIQLGSIYLVVLLAGSCAQFFNPARLVLISDIVEEPARAKATSMQQMTLSLVVIIGPALATTLFNAVGVQWALVINALSFVVSLCAVYAIRVPTPTLGVQRERHKFWTEFLMGIKFCLNNRVLAPLMIALVLSLLGIGCVNSLTVFFVTQNLHVSASHYGLLASALGAGTLIGALLAGMFTQRLGIGRTFWLSLLATGMLFFLFSRVTSFALAVVVIFCLGFPISATNVSLMPLVLSVTPRELIGRVAAVLNPIQSLSLMASIAITGYLESTLLSNFHATLLGMQFGPVDTIFTGTSVMVLIGGFYTMINLRKSTKTVLVDTSAVVTKQ